MSTPTVQKKMTDIGEKVRTYTRIARDQNGEFIIFIQDGENEVAFTSFASNQVGMAVHLNGDNQKQEFYYHSDGPNSGLKLSGRPTCCHLSYVVRCRPPSDESGLSAPSTHDLKNGRGIFLFPWWRKS